MLYYIVISFWIEFTLYIVVGFCTRVRSILKHSRLSLCCVLDCKLVIFSGTFARFKKELDVALEEE